MLSSRPMDPIIDQSHGEGNDGEGDKVVHLSTQAGKMRLRESDAAPGYEALTPQHSPPHSQAAESEGETVEAATVHQSTGFHTDKPPIPGGGAELANAESLGGASQAAHTARLSNVGGTAPSPQERPSSAAGPNSNKMLSSIGRLGSGFNSSHTVGPGATGLASARGVDNVESQSGTPSQFVFPKLGTRRMSEAMSGSGISQLGQQSPTAEHSGISTPEHEKSSAGGSMKKGKKEHHNPLVDLRRVSSSLERIWGKCMPSDPCIFSLLLVSTQSHWSSQ